MAIKLYDLRLKGDRRPSPFCWRAKFALAHTGLAWTEVPIGFTDKAALAFAQSTLVPVIDDGGTPVKDSWQIALHLEATRPERPLFKSTQARAFAEFASGWTDQTVHPGLFPLLVADLYDKVEDKDRAYFLETRGKRFPGRTFDEVQRTARESAIPAFRASLHPARRALGTGVYLCGEHPGWADYALASALLWCRAVSSFKPLAEDDALVPWFERMLDLYDGMGRRAPATS